LKPTDDPAAGRGRAVVCDLTARAKVRVPPEALAELRRCPGPSADLPSAFLKHTDEQTVAGLAAVYHAIHDHGLDPASFRDWGVLGGPCALGRPTMASALQKFLEEGAWGVSPHLIPHRSLHSLSGTVSQALKIHGANYGVGGGPTSPAEALLAAAAMLGLECVPGVWVVLTAFDPDAPPDRAGNLPPGTHYLGIALALTTPRLGWNGPRLRFRASVAQPAAPRLDLALLVDLLEHVQAPQMCTIDGGGLLELEWPALGAGGARVRHDGACPLPPPHCPVAVEADR
jgi:hypothetical protein